MLLLCSYKKSSTDHSLLLHHWSGLDRRGRSQQEGWEHGGTQQGHWRLCYSSTLPARLDAHDSLHCTCGWPGETALGEDAHVHKYPHTHLAHTCTQIYKHTRTNRHTDTDIHIFTYIHTQTCTHTHIIGIAGNFFFFSEAVWRWMHCDVGCT